MGVGDEKRAGFLLLAVLLPLMVLSAEYCLRATSLTVADDSNSSTTTATSHLRNAAAFVLDNDHEVKVEWLTADDMMLDFFKQPPNSRIIASAPPGALPNKGTRNSLNPTGTIPCPKGEIVYGVCLGEMPPGKNIAGSRSGGH